MLVRVAVLAVFCGGWFLPAAQAAQAGNEPEVLLEVRVLSVAEPMFERIGIDFEGASDLPKTAANPQVDLQTLGQAFLTDVQVSQLLKALQGDRRSNVMQFPRLTLSNNLSGNLEITDTRYFLTGIDWVSVAGQVRPSPKNEPFKMGDQIWAKPVVSADGRSVQLSFKFQRTELSSAAVPLIPVQLPVPAVSTKPSPEVMLQVFLQQPQFSTLKIDKTVTIPIGQTAVFSGFKKSTETRTETSPPVLAKVPYLNRLFRNVGYSQETQTLVVLVTPRIVGDGGTAVSARK
jgi:type II secretory pathway component GspD/PulD (secretin)